MWYYSYKCDGNKITILAFILAEEHPILELIKTNLEV